MKKDNPKVINCYLYQNMFNLLGNCIKLWS